FGVVLAHGHVQRHAAAYIAAAHDVKHSPEPGPIAIVPIGVVENVGCRPRPGRARGIARRIQLVELDIRCHPERHARAVRPANHRPFVVRQVPVQARVPNSAHPALFDGSARTASSTSATGSTSAYLTAMSYRFAK